MSAREIKSLEQLSSVRCAAGRVAVAHRGDAELLGGGAREERGYEGSNHAGALEWRCDATASLLRRVPSFFSAQCSVGQLKWRFRDHRGS